MPASTCLVVDNAALGAVEDIDDEQRSLSLGELRFIKLVALAGSVDPLMRLRLDEWQSGQITPLSVRALGEQNHLSRLVSLDLSLINRLWLDTFFALLSMTPLLAKLAFGNIKAPRNKYEYPFWDSVNNDADDAEEVYTKHLARKYPRPACKLRDLEVYEAHDFHAYTLLLSASHDSLKRVSLVCISSENADYASCALQKCMRVRSVVFMLNAFAALFVLRACPRVSILTLQFPPSPSLFEILGHTLRELRLTQWDYHSVPAHTYVANTSKSILPMLPAFMNLRRIVFEISLPLLPGPDSAPLMRLRHACRLRRISVEIT